MQDVSLNVTKSDVFLEVAKTTAYEGKKDKDDAKAYERVSTTDSDQTMLDRFFDEAATIATDTLKRFIKTVANDKGYSVTLSLSSAYDTNLNAALQKGLFSFFVNTIIAKWDKLANKGNVDSYEDEANAALLDIQAKIFYRKPPSRN